VTDVTGDRLKAEIIVAITGNNTVTALINDGTGKFPTQQVTYAGRAPTALALADVNSDGRMDWLVADKNGDTSHHPVTPRHPSWRRRVLVDFLRNHRPHSGIVSVLKDGSISTSSGNGVNGAVGVAGTVVNFRNHQFLQQLRREAGWGAARW